MHNIFPNFLLSIKKWPYMQPSNNEESIRNHWFLTAFATLSVLKASVSSPQEMVGVKIGLGIAQESQSCFC